LKFLGYFDENLAIFDWALFIVEVAGKKSRFGFSAAKLETHFLYFLN